MPDLVKVYGWFRRADEDVILGKVSFWPVISAVDETVDEVIVTQATVSGILDTDGYFEIETRASDDDGWRITGDMPYSVQISVTGLNRSYTCYIPSPGPWNIADLIVLDAMPEVIIDMGPVGPEGPTGPQGVQGSPGIQGVQGPPGIGSYPTIIDVSTASTTWTVDIGIPCAVVTLNATGDVIEPGSIKYNGTQITMTFSSAVAGKVHCYT